MTVSYQKIIQQLKSAGSISLIVSILTFMLGGCVYKIPVQQGNIVTPEMLAQLEKDMNKRQVEYVMGTPLIKDMFNKDRWDYIFTKRIKGDLVEKYKISVFFTDEKFTHYEGTLPKGKLNLTTPKTKDFVESPDTKMKPGGSDQDGTAF